MCHFQTSQRFRSDVDPCYLWNKERKKRPFSLWLAAEPAGQSNTKAMVQEEAQHSSKLCGAEKATDLLSSCFYCGNPEVFDSGRWAVMTLEAFQALCSFYT